MGIFGKKKDEQIPAMSDRELANRQYGSFLGWLRRSRLPEPTIGELRIMLFIDLHKEFQESVQSEKDKVIEKWKMHHPLVAPLIRVLENQPEKREMLMLAIQEIEKMKEPALKPGQVDLSVPIKH